MTPPKLLLFDLDGTLIDSRRDLAACVNATLDRCQLPPLPQDQIAGLIGDGAAALVERSLRAAAAASAFAPNLSDHQALDFFLSYYREHLLDHTEIYPGVLSTLAALAEDSSAPLMAVLTNKPVMPSRRICDALGISPFLYANYGGNSGKTKKPDPAGLVSLWRAAEALRGQSIAAGEVVMIGDSEIDIRTARNAGVTAWGCMWGFSVAKMLAEAPDALAETPEDWLALAAAHRTPVEICLTALPD